MSVVGLNASTLTAPRTVRDLLHRSFRIAHILGKGEVLDTDEARDAFHMLNHLIEQANLDKLFALYQTEIVVPLVASQATYTIGPATVQPSPSVEAPRPVEILSAFSRRDGLDHPLDVTHQKPDFDLIQQKSLGGIGWVDLLYYQATFPAGTLYVYPLPLDGLTSLYLTVMAQVTAFTALEEEVALPPGYTAWLEYKLAQRLCPEYGQTFSKEAEAILVEAEAALTRNNIKPLPVSITDLSALSGGYGVYDVLGDRTR